MFFGTPHQGSRVATWPARLAKLLYVSSTRLKILEPLTVGSEVLTTLADSFESCKKNLVIVSVIEQRPIWRFVVVVPTQSARISGDDPVPLERDHREICRFQDEEDNDYVTIREKLKKLSSKASDNRLRAEAADAYNKGK